MIVSLIRVCILYLLILLSVRLMGRRQVGELQPSELVITILISEIACVPIQDNGIPILSSVVAVLVLAALEILFSALSLKSEGWRKLMQGNPIAVIRDGELDQNALKKLRITLDDLLEGMREKSVFDLSQVQYAVLESNGKLSIQLKPAFRGTTAQMLNIAPDDSGMVCPLVFDGKVQTNNFALCGMTEKRFHAAVKQSGIPLSQIFLMTADRSGTVQCIRKEPNK